MNPLGRLLLSLVLLANLCPAPPARAGIPEAIHAAETARKEGRTDQALEAYLAALPGIEAAEKSDRQALLRGLFDTCLALLAQDRATTALRGLTALLAPTHAASSDAGFAAQVRQTLEDAAAALVNVGQGRSAIEALKGLMADSPGGPMRWALLARAHLDASEFEQASDTLKRGLGLFPDAPELLFTRAALAGSLSEVAVAGSAYKTAESLLQDAAADLAQAAKRAPKVPGIQRAQGKAQSSLWVYYRATGQPRLAFAMLFAAEDAYAEATRLDPANPEPPFELGQLLFTAEDWRAAREAYRQSLSRFQIQAQRQDITPAARLGAQRNVDRCLQNIVATLHNQALDAVNTGYFEFARRLVDRAAQEAPFYATEEQRFLKLLSLRSQAFDSQLALIERQQPSGDSKVALGDFWFRHRRFKEAEEAYLQAKGAPMKNLPASELEDRLFAVRELPDDAHTTLLQLGDLGTTIEAPAGLDLGMLAVALEKAHALTMGIFPFRLNGTLSIKVFPNQRAFLEGGGVRIGPGKRAFYAYGRIVTYQEPHRSRGRWQKILLHEITHRIIDEMSYARAPHWLAEGLALWVSDPWSKALQRRIQKLASEKALFPWSRMEGSFVEFWNDPVLLTNLTLQSQAMVRWMIQEFGMARMMVLMAALRQGLAIEMAASAAFGESLESLERRWGKAL